ncbi:trypsin-like serine protease [Actinokineospora auranticolor]|uniref:Secreted trypsin-like serine protease n=1 Tax=Actinokineospora auranticolor TaxID=155976 RepID=A0A2S6GZ79_9PSEU|nr:trypsin-like serine protease [Actinokineospora auranticolor]PPK70467.1 secreted trypsin-like serine protease [Actinokineospora auranticolor]
MKRTPRSWGLLALAAATVLVPLGATIASAAEAAPPANAPANYEGSTVPARSGDASPMFANGEDATVSEFPGIVAGIRAGGPRPEGQTCTGTVVAPRKILIAAHCADAAGEKKFVYGLDDLKDYQGGSGSGLAVGVVSYKKHPKYVNFDQGYDVAVVTVDRDIPLKGGAAYPQFATSADAGGAAPGKSGQGFGYGKKDFDDNSFDATLDKATLPIVNGDSLCQGVGAGFKSAYMICAGYNDGRVTILPGDSGGPLVVGGKVYGVASWSRSDFKWYSIYGRLDNEMGDWVKQEVGTVTEPPTGDLGVRVDPGSGSVAAGKYLSTTVATTGSGENATLSASGLPSGVKAVFQPTSVATGSSAKLTFDAAADAANGTYEVTVTATTSGGQTATGKFSLTVTGGGNPEPGDLTLAASPSSVKAAKGKYVSTTINSTGGGRGQNLTLSAAGLPTGVKAVFQPTTIAAGSSAKLTLDVSATAAAGTSTITVTGTDTGGKTATTTVSLTVEGTQEPPTGDVTVTVTPASGSGFAGSLVQTTVRASGGTGTLRLTATGAPAGTQVTFNPATIAQGGASNVWFFTGFGTPAGTYPITITATSADGKTGKTTFTLTVTRLGGF